MGEADKKIVGILLREQSVTTANDGVDEVFPADGWTKTPELTRAGRKPCKHACCFPVYQRRARIREKFRVHFLMKRMGRDSSLHSHNLYSRPATALIHGRTLNGTKTTCEKSNCITTLSLQESRCATCTPLSRLIEKLSLN